MKIDKRSNTQFGWFYGTHKRVTRFALKNMDNLRPYKDALEIFSQKPDFDEVGKFNNWHFYSKSQRSSFLDFNRKDNALARYKYHVKEINKGLQEDNIDRVIEHTGRSLHYLHDMTQPQHVQKGFTFNKLLHLKLHMDFEEFVKTNQEDCFSSYIEKPFEDKSFIQIFWENVNFSEKSKLPLRNNRYEWEYIGRDGINQAIRSTKEFLNKVDNLLSTNGMYKQK